MIIYAHESISSKTTFLTRNRQNRAGRKRCQSGKRVGRCSSQIANPTNRIFQHSRDSADVIGHRHHRETRGNAWTRVTTNVILSESQLFWRATLDIPSRFPVSRWLHVPMADATACMRHLISISEFTDGPGGELE